MRLVIARCPKCSCEFALSREVMDEMVQLTCPRCERVFEPPEQVFDGEDEIETDEDVSLDENDGETGEDDGEVGDQPDRTRRTA